MAERKDGKPKKPKKPTGFHKNPLNLSSKKLTEAELYEEEVKEERKQAWLKKLKRQEKKDG